VLVATFVRDYYVSEPNSAVPTLKTYVNEDGYYINARPPEVGNITYQVDASLWEFFEDLGYEDGSEVEWSLVKSFRIAGLVYTNASGVSAPDEDVVGLDPSKLSELSPDAVDRLLDYIDGRNDIESAKKAEIERYIRERTGSGSIPLSSKISEAVTSALSPDATRASWRVGEVVVSESNDRTLDITIRIEPPRFDLATFDRQTVRHRISNVRPTDSSAEGEPTSWEIEVESPSWEEVAEILRQQAALIGELRETLSEDGYDLGRPETLLPGSGSQRSENSGRTFRLE